MPTDSRLRRSIRNELVRICATRPVGETINQKGLVLIVAVQFFEAPPLLKGTLAAAFFIGLLLGPPSVLAVARWQLPVSRAMALLNLLTAAAMLAIGLFDDLVVFTISALVAGACLGMLPPLGTALWRQNMPDRLRGHLFSRVGLVATLCAIGVGWGIAAWLGDDAGRYQPVFLVLAGFQCLATIAAWRTPSRPLEPTQARNPFANLALVWRDRLFGYLCAVWMLVGFGNLVTMPLRVEFMANRETGLGLDPDLVVFLNAVLPECLTLLAMPLWGRLFDRINFIKLRIAINVCFMLSIIATFAGSMPLLILGSALLGIAAGGGQIAWNLWVTKFADPERTADYMSVHTFLTGCRGMVAGFLAFGLVGGGVLAIEDFAVIGASLIGLSILGLLPIIKYGRR